MSCEHNNPEHYHYCTVCGEQILSVRNNETDIQKDLYCGLCGKKNQQADDSAIKHQAQTLAFTKLDLSKLIAEAKSELIELRSEEVVKIEQQAINALFDQQKQAGDK